MASNRLAALEATIERLLERPFFRLFGGRLEPADIAKRLGRAQEDNRVLAAGKLLAPNNYRVILNPSDLAGFKSYESVLRHELATYLMDLADRRNLTMTSKPEIELVADTALSRGQIEVEARLADPSEHAGAAAQYTQPFDAAAIQAAAIPAQPAQLVIGGRVVPIDQPFLTLGRNIDNDIIIESDDVSRQHAQIKLRQGRYVLTDLNSANGTRVNGQRVSEHVLHDGDVIQLAGVEIRFQLPSLWRASQG
ncbi:MAG: FHA domain-containing protein [Ardenticatenaceae bacterium]|nr:FHA domain-containing protein [Ardenticatenaceae bacterium]